MRRVAALAAMTVLGLALLVRTAGPASQNGSTPPGAGGLAGRFLVASEDMGDPRFAQTVILVVRHDAGGAMGVIVNRPMAEVPAAKLLEGVGLDPAGARGDIRLHYGGPVDRRQVLTLHTPEYATGGTLRVGTGMAMTGNPEILRAIGSGGGPKRYLVALGYAGWSPGQLESEMQAGAWFDIPADEALVFGADHEKTWERARARRRIQL